MPHFKKRFKTDFGTPQFVFDRIFTVNGAHYHVSVVDDKGRSQFFNMQFKKDEWVIIDAPKVPDWIMGLQNELSKAIIDHKPFV